MDQDTPRTRARYLEHLQRLTPVERLRAAFALTAGVRTLAMTGLRMRHPTASDEELRARLAAQLYGRTVARRLYGTAAGEEPR